ncbi:FtsX-like permease family protein [Lewinella sp. W8]|uniref:FtsX-like permease family protein n=1 Tax=Lewinella sp. W8 TaxID=2528208 RepID=UPI001068D311|nr:FtsX-like permease family protein [Lewinella sp. W8]MTB53672.1 FtsX-like permease family protein [Lewinella sp. W8]
MNLPVRISWRYLFARKSTNAINIITLIAAFGVAIGAAALILLLSVFNGFEDLFLGLFNNLNPDVRITTTKGKTFEMDEETLRGLYALDGVLVVSQTLEETAGFLYDDKQAFGRVKGVDHRYAEINGIDTMVQDGSYDLHLPSRKISGAIVGNQLSIVLGIDPLNEFSPLTVLMSKPRPRGGGMLTSGRAPYIRRNFQPAGIIRSQEAFENQAVLIDLEEARELLSVEEGIVSALEIRLAPGYDIQDTYDRIQEYMGADFTVKDRYQQENSILKLMQVEKWVGFAIVCLMMILISFNLVGALWMIVLEKKRDISILKSLGMTRRDIRGIFLRVGLLLCSLGIGVGFLLAAGLYILQKNYGLISLPGMMTEAYPISFRWLDFPVVAGTVLIIGFLASLLPAWRAQQIEASIHEE